MGNKTVSWLSVVATAISIAAILLVLLEVEPIDVNFFGGLVAVLSILVIVVTWFQLSKGLSEETRIRNMVEGHVNTVINQSLNMLIEQITKLHDADLEIIGLAKKESESINKRCDFITKIHISSEVKHLSTYISSIKDVNGLLTSLPMVVDVVGHVDILLKDIDDNEMSDFINLNVHPVLDQLREAVSALEFNFKFENDKEDDLKDVLTQLDEVAKSMSYRSSSSLIKGLYRLFNLDNTDDTLPVLRS